MANFGWARKNFGSRTAYSWSPPKILGHGPPMVETHLSQLLARTRAIKE